MLGSMTFSMSANFISSCSATFTKGREGILDALPLTSANAATARTNCAEPLLLPDFVQSSGCCILTLFCSRLEGRCRAKKEGEASANCVLPLQDAMLSRNVCILHSEYETNFSSFAKGVLLPGCRHQAKAAPCA